MYAVIERKEKFRYADEGDAISSQSFLIIAGHWYLFAIHLILHFTLAHLLLTDIMITSGKHHEQQMNEE